MTALPLTRLAPQEVRPDAADKPVALLQLDLSDVATAALAVYREVRRGRHGRRVVAVAAAPADASARLAAALDAIGVAAVRPAPGEALLHDGVAIVPGPEIAASRHWPVIYADLGVI